MFMFINLCSQQIFLEKYYFKKYFQWPEKLGHHFEIF